MARASGSIALAIAVILTSCGSVHAQVPTVSTYVGGSGNWIVDFDDIDDWQHLPPPLPGIDLFLFPDNNSTRLFSVFTGTGSGNFLRLNNPLPVAITINDLHVRRNDTFELDNTTLQISFPGFVENDGTIILDDGQIATPLLLPGLLSLRGGGQIQMNGSSAAIGSFLGALDIDGQTIRGRGLITGTTVGLDAEIDANQVGETLNLTFTISGDSDGNLFASDGGKLEIKSAVGSTSDFNNGGLIQARRGGVVELREMDFDNDGLVQAIDNGVINLKDTAVDNTGHVFDIQQGQMNLRGDVTINGGAIQTGPGGLVVNSEGVNDLTGGMTLIGNFQVGGTALDFEPGSYNAAAARFDVRTLLNLHAATVIGGTFSGPGEVFVRESSTLINSTIDGGNFRVPGSPGGFVPRTLTLVDTLTLNSGGVVTIRDDRIGFGTHDAWLQIDRAVTIGGDGGTIRFGRSTHEFEKNLIVPINGGHLTLGPNIRIEAPGSGALGFIVAPLTNHGTVDANGGEIYMDGPTITNRNTIGASAGGTMHLRNGVSIDNVGGRIVAGTNSRVNYNSTTIIGGTLAGEGTHFNQSRTTFLNGSASPITLDDATLLMPGNTRLTLSGTLVNDGTIYMSDQVLGFGTINAEFIAAGDVNIHGTGQIVFDQVNHSNNNNELRAADASSSFTFGKDLTVTTEVGKRGFGTFYAPVQNQGLIQSHNGFINFYNIDTINTGTIKATAGGLVEMGLPGQSMKLNNTGGRLIADVGSTIQYAGTTVIGGTIEGEGVHRPTGRDTVFDSSTQAITLDGDVFIAGNNRLTLRGALNHTGTIRMSDQVLGFGTINAELVAAGNVTITGPGQILLDATNHSNNNNEFRAADGASSFTFGPDLLITTEIGKSGIGAFFAPIHNHGTIQAHNGSLSFLNTTTTNTGTIKAVAGGQIRLGFENQPTLIDNRGGTLFADSQSFFTASGFTGGMFGQTTIRGGTLTGGGEFRLGPFMILDGTSEAFTIRDATARMYANSAFGAFTHIQGQVHLDNGTFALRDANTFNRLIMVGDDARFTGTGTILFEGANFGDPSNRLESAAPLHIGAGLRVTTSAGGAGNIAANTVQNQGVFDAAGGRIHFESDLITNTGTLGASAGGTLILGKSDFVAFTIDNAGGGQMVAEAGSTVQIGHLLQLFGAGTTATIRGGTFSGGGTFRNSATAHFISTPDNPTTFGPGTITARGSTNTHFSGEFQMQGGTLKIDDNAAGFGTLEPVFHAVGQTRLIGTGTVLFGPQGFQHNNILRADGANSWNMDAGITLTAPTAAIGIIQGTVNTHGTIHSDGLLRIERGTTTVFADGMVTGAGTIEVARGAALINHGATSPGNSPGLLTINGDYTLTDTSHLLIEIGGTDPALYDRLQVNGRFFADGQLDIVLVNGFIPTPGDSFSFLNATAGIFGDFDTITTQDGSFTVSRSNNGFTLTDFMHTPIPEPTTLALLGLAAVLTLGRRRPAR